MKQYGEGDCASVGMKLPNGTFLGPITADHLFWVRPGKDATEQDTLRRPEIVRLCACLPTDCFSRASVSSKISSQLNPFLLSF